MYVGVQQLFLYATRLINFLFSAQGYDAGASHIKSFSEDIVNKNT